MTAGAAACFPAGGRLLRSAHAAGSRGSLGTGGDFVGRHVVAMNPRWTISRRWWLAALIVGGCSSKSRSGPTNKLPGSYSRSDRKRAKGPQTMGTLLLDSYVKDLDSPSAQTRARAARELGNMGGDAKSAVPKLEKLAGDKDAAVSTAAKQALKSIRK
jgi:hypothetical protein